MLRPERNKAPAGDGGRKQLVSVDQESSYPTQRSFAKQLIVALGARGFLKPRLADALNRIGGLRHA